MDGAEGCHVALEQLRSRHGGDGPSLGEKGRLDPLSSEQELGAPSDDDVGRQHWNQLNPGVNLRGHRPGGRNHLVASRQA